MDGHTASGIIMLAVILAGTAVLFFEGWQLERRENRRICVCDHRYGGPGMNSHVRKSDADSDWFAPGDKQRKVGSCRTCRCRSFNPKVTR